MGAIDFSIALNAIFEKKVWKTLVYINENMTPFSWDLLYHTGKFQKANGWKFSWFSRLVGLYWWGRKKSKAVDYWKTCFKRFSSKNKCKYCKSCFKWKHWKYVSTSNKNFTKKVSCVYICMVSFECGHTNLWLDSFHLFIIKTACRGMHVCLFSIF